MKRTLALLTLAPLLCVAAEAQTQTVRNSSIFAPNPAGWLLDPAGGPSVGGVWTPAVDSSVYAPPAAPGSSWIIAVTAGPLDFLMPAPGWGVLLCDPTPPTFVVAGPPDAGPGAVPVPLPVPLDCGLIGAGFCTQAALFDLAVGPRFANAIDIVIGGGPGGLYSVSNGDSLLRTVSTSTAATLSSVAITMSGFSVSGANGLVKHPITGELYAILQASGGPSPLVTPPSKNRKSGKRKKSGPGASTSGADGLSGRALATVCPITGAATFIGDTGDSFAGIAFDSSGTLWGVTGDGGFTSESLYTISTSDGSATFVTSLGNGDDGEMLAYNSVDGLLYHGSGNLSFAATPDIFETIDPSDPTATPVDIPLGLPLNNDETNAVSAFQPGIGAFYWGSGCCSASANSLYTASATGAAVLIGGLDHTPKGLAVLP